jgi:hypothetical protein
LNSNDLNSNDLNSNDLNSNDLNSNDLNSNDLNRGARYRRVFRAISFKVNLTYWVVKLTISFFEQFFQALDAWLNLPAKPEATV